MLSWHQALKHENKRAQGWLTGVARLRRRLVLRPSSYSSTVCDTMLASSLDLTFRRTHHRRSRAKVKVQAHLRVKPEGVTSPPQTQLYTLSRRHHRWHFEYHVTTRGLWCGLKRRKPSFSKTSKLWAHH